MTLRLSGLNVSYERPHRPPVHVVVDVDFEVGPGDVVGLVGESGCGKSTLARAAIGLVPRTSGEVTFGGREVAPLGRGRRDAALRRMQMIFQDPYASLNPRRRVGAQIADGLRGDPSDDTKRMRRVGELLEQVGLNTSIARRYPFEFSGGQRQRIAIARALAADPQIIIADEAVSALDASTQAQVANLLVRLARERDAGLLFISHDLGIVRHICDDVAVMYLGKIVEQGATDTVWERPAHPYTRALIAAVPHHDGSGTLPEALEGEVPDPSRPPPGCRFHPRCPERVDRCAEDVPVLVAISAVQRAACWVTAPPSSDVQHDEDLQSRAEPDPTAGLDQKERDE
jgi:peptide/nickel transport system ATP-binding protein